MTQIFKKGLIPVALILSALFVYFSTAIKNPTNFDYFMRLGESFMQGKLYVNEAPPHLNELVTSGEDGKWYVVYPPMPAIVSIPFIYFNIAEKSQTFIAIIFGAMNAGLMYCAAVRIYGKKIAVYVSLSLIYGTNHWFLSTDGSAWYIAHVMAVTWILFAILVLKINQNNLTQTTTEQPKWWLLAGLCVGAGYWTRLPAILAVPFFIYLSTVNAHKIKQSYKAILWKVLFFGIGVSVFVSLNFGYNYLRFNTVRDISYELIPGVLEEPWYEHGIISHKYLIKNTQFILLKSPIPYQEFPYFKPSLEGMSLLLTSPFLVLLLFIRWGNKLALVALLTALGMLLPGLMHGNPGFTQFGFRFSLEAMPLFLLSLGSALTRKYAFYVAIPLLLVAISINYWGVQFMSHLHIYGW